MKKAKRAAVCFVIIAACFLLETTLLTLIPFVTVVPNLMIIVTSAFGFMRGKKEGLWIGFACGLLKDILGGGLLGFNALIYLFLGYCNGFFRRLFYDEDVKLPIALIGISDFVYGLLVYVCMFMLKSDFNFLFYFRNIIMPELVYTLLATVVLYQIIMHVNRRLEEDEKRSASKFV